jgi:hypothetical protein
MAYAWQRQGLLDNTPSWAGPDYQARNEEWYRRMAPAPLLPLPSVEPPAVEQPAGLLAPETMPAERQTWADRQADPYDPARSSVEADSFLEALGRMATGGLAVMGPLGGAGVLGNLVATDVMGLPPSISTIDTARAAMGRGRGVPVDGSLATMAPPASDVRFRRTASYPRTMPTVPSAGAVTVRSAAPRPPQIDPTPMTTPGRASAAGQPGLQPKRSGDIDRVLTEAYGRDDRVRTEKQGKSRK